MLTGTSGLLIVLLCLSLNAQARSDGQTFDYNKQNIAVDELGFPLDRIIHIANANKVPLGIIFGQDQKLCAERTAVTTNGRSIKKAMEVLSLKSGYNLSFVNGVAVLQVKDLSPQQTKALSLAFPRIPATVGTMSYMGLQLAALIQTSLKNSNGYIIDSMSNGKGQQLSSPEMIGFNTVSVANRIVSLGPGGIWTLYPEVMFSIVSKSDVVFRTYSFADNQPQIQALSCSRQVT